jgi:anti-sigma factor RsiW
MPMSEPEWHGQGTLDEGLTAKVSAYLDGELHGPELAQFEALLQADRALALEVAGMRRIGRHLAKLGADVLEEPIPEALLETLSRLEDHG